MHPTGAWAGRVAWVSLAEEDAADDRVQPLRHLVRDAAELDLELEGLALGRLGQGGEHLGDGPPLGEPVARLAPGEPGEGQPPELLQVLLHARRCVAPVLAPDLGPPPHEQRHWLECSHDSDSGQGIVAHIDNRAANYARCLKRAGIPAGLGPGTTMVVPSRCERLGGRHGCCAGQARELTRPSELQAGNWALANGPTVAAGPDALATAPVTSA